MAPTPPKVTKSPKVRRVTLNVEQKLDLLRKLESGRTVAQVCEEFGCKKQTVSDIKKNKDKIRSYAAKYCVEGNRSKAGKCRARKNMATADHSQLDAAVLKWFLQQRATGLNVRGVEIMSAAVKLAQELGIENFKGSDGWLWRFRNRHGLFNVTAHEAADFFDLLKKAGEKDVSLDDVHDWLDESESVQGHAFYTEAEIAEQIKNPEPEVQESSDEEEEPVKRPKLSSLRASLDDLIAYTEYTPEAASHYTQLRLLRDIIIRKQHQVVKQTKIDSFFAPLRPVTTTQEPQPGPSSAPDPGALISEDEVDDPMVVDSATDAE